MPSDGGKGSSPRPFSVDQKTFDENWCRVFGKNNSELKENNKDEKVTPLSFSEKAG